MHKEFLFIVAAQSLYFHTTIFYILDVIIVFDADKSLVTLIEAHFQENDGKVMEFRILFSIFSESVKESE